MSVAVNLVDPGRGALCAPVFDHSGKLVAAIAVIGPQDRIDTAWDNKPARELAFAMGNLSRRLGAPTHLVE